MQGFDTPEDEEAIHRSRNGATAFLNEIEFFPEVGVVHHQSALDHIAVPAEVFGGGMHYDVGAQVERVLEVGEAKVLSTHSRALADFAIAAAAAMSVMFINGFVGVSSQINLVLAVTACLILSAWVVST